MSECAHALTENRILHRELEATRELLKGAREEIDKWKTWGVVEIAVRNPNVASYIQEWEKRATEAEAENEKLRGLLAQGAGDCVYCGLPAADIAKCPSGFPGCARMDDIVNAQESDRDSKWQEVIDTKDKTIAILHEHLRLAKGESDGRKPEPTK